MTHIKFSVNLFTFKLTSKPKSNSRRMISGRSATGPCHIGYPYASLLLGSAPASNNRRANFNKTSVAVGLSRFGTNKDDSGVSQRLFFTLTSAPFSTRNSTMLSLPWLQACRRRVLPSSSGVTCCLDAPFSTDTGPETTLPDNPHSRKTRHISLYLEPGPDYRLHIPVHGSTLTNDPPHNRLPPEPNRYFDTVRTIASRLESTFYRGQ